MDLSTILREERLDRDAGIPTYDTLVIRFGYGTGPGRDIHAYTIPPARSVERAWKWICGEDCWPGCCSERSASSRSTRPWRRAPRAAMALPWRRRTREPRRAAAMASPRHRSPRRTDHPG